MDQGGAKTWTLEYEKSVAQFPNIKPGEEFTGNEKRIFSE
jgi:hypothetical protein